MTRIPLRRHLATASGLFILLSVLAMMLAVVVATRHADQDARTREARSVVRGLSLYGQEQVDKAIPQAYWDEAVIHLDNRFDPAWAQKYIGEYLLATGRIDLAAVADGDDHFRYYTLAGSEVVPPEAPGLLDAARPLLVAIRARESARGMAPARGASGVKISRPLTARRITRVDNRLVLLSAVLVQPDRFARLSGKRAPILVSGKIFDRSAVIELGRIFGLEDPRLQLGAKAIGADRNKVVFTAPTGALATLDWKADRPGTRIVTRMLPVVALIAFLLAAAVLAALRRADRLAGLLEESGRRARRLARHDLLTGLPNRFLFDQRVVRALAAHRRLALFCVDLDHFKVVNDTLGHQAGDELLRRAASILRSACSHGEGVARIGGDEFALTLAGADRAAAAAVAEAVIEKMGHPIDLPQGRVFIGASLGIVILDGDEGISADEALRRADLALYQAKAQGRGRYAFFEPELDAAAQARQKLHERLHAALDDGSLRLLYQPQVGGDGRIEGAEALLRWGTGERDPVPVAELIELAEETGLIEQLGYYTLECAFRDSAGLGGLPLSINMSAIQLRLPDFVARVGEIVERTGVDPSRFALELTESALLEDEPDTLARMNQLKAMGFAIVLDDFGTGFSSLGYLQRFPFDRVKIDRSFVSLLGEEAQADAVVSAIVRLARALDLDVVAEGVETPAQRRRLAEAGCDHVQGYLTGRPMPASELAARLAAEARQADEVAE